MPIIHSAKKRARQSVVRRERNLITKRRVKEARKALAAVRNRSDKKKLAVATSSLQSALDTAVKKNLIHKNKAARILSRSLSSSTTKPAKTPTPKKAATKKTAVKKTPAKKAVAKKTSTKKAATKKPAKK